MLKKLGSKQIYKIIIIWLFLFFIICGIDFAFNIKPGVSPDENYHIQLTEEYSKGGLFASNSEETYRLGNIEDIPNLYHFALGKLLVFNIFGMENYIFLRLISLVFSTLTCYFVYKLTQLLTDKKSVQLLSLVLVTNIPIFSFIAASVNYDALANLFSILSIFLFFVYLKNNKHTTLLWLIIILCLGALTKISFLPLALIIVILLAINMRKKLREPKFFAGFRHGLSIVALVAVLLTSYFYIRNLYKYHAPVPSCTDTLSHESCLINPVYERDYVGQQKADIDTVGIGTYLYKWSFYMFKSTINQTGHQTISKPKFALIPYFAVILFAVIGVIRKYKFKNKQINYLMSIIAFHALFLIFYQNYPSYLKHGLPYLGVQGRYMLPVLGPITFLLASGSHQFKNKYLNFAVIVAVATLFIFGNYIYFKWKIDHNWL